MLFENARPTLPELMICSGAMISVNLTCLQKFNICRGRGMSRKDGLLALLVVVVWGLNFVVIKVGLHNMPPLMLAG